MSVCQSPECPSCELWVLHLTGAFKNDEEKFVTIINQSGMYETLACCKHGTPVKYACVDCEEEGVKKEIKTSCTCKCHVSQNVCCLECTKIMPVCKISIEDFKITYPDCVEETITIKKKLWDEMVECKKRIEKLEISILDDERLRMIENRLSYQEILTANIQNEEKIVQCPTCSGRFKLTKE